MYHKLSGFLPVNSLSFGSTSDCLLSAQSAFSPFGPFTAEKHHRLMMDNFQPFAFPILCRIAFHITATDRKDTNARDDWFSAFRLPAFL
jgi:hypothetical protein